MNIDKLVLLQHPQRRREVVAFVQYLLAPGIHVRITENQSGSAIFDGPEPETATGSIEEVTDVIIDHIYTGDLARADADGHIPSGCAAYRTETRRTAEYEDWCCWEALDWFAAET